jgi:hypothetical protein
VTIDAEACNELRAVFHLLGESMDLTLGEPLKPWPFPTGKAPEKQPEPEKEMPPPLAASNGLLTEQSGRYCGPGFNGEA